MTGYSTREACAAAGITYRMADYWARTELVVPSLREAKGSGSQRSYSYGDVITLAVIKRLVDNGLSLQSVRRAVARLGTVRADELDGTALVLAAGEVFVTELPDLADLLRSGSGMFQVLPFAGLVDEVDARLDEFDAARSARYAGTHAPAL